MPTLDDPLLVFSDVDGTLGIATPATGSPRLSGLPACVNIVSPDPL